MQLAKATQKKGLPLLVRSSGEISLGGSPCPVPGLSSHLPLQFGTQISEWPSVISFAIEDLNNNSTPATWKSNFVVPER